MNLNMNIADTIQVVSCVVAAITSFFTFKTLKEMKKQREADNQPILIVLEKEFIIKMTENNQVVDFLIDINKLNTNMELINIGNAPANSIIINLTIDKDELARNFNKAIMKNDYIEYKEARYYGDDTTEVSIKKEFILPGLDNKILFNLPGSFLRYILIYFYVNCNSKLNTFLSIIIFG